MPSVTPSSPIDASLTQRGVVSLVAQQFAGEKSFVSSTANAGGRALTAGTSVADGSVNEGFRLLSLRTGIGGSEVEWLRARRPTGYASGVLEIDQQGVTNTYGLRVIGAGSGISGIQLQTNFLGQVVLSQQQSGSPAMLYSENKGLLLSQNANAYDSTTLMRFVVAGPTGVATSVPAFKFESGALGSGQPLAKFSANGVELLTLSANGLTAGGDFENTATGGALILKSPDGTRWKLTITNAGVVNVAAA